VVPSLLIVLSAFATQEPVRGPSTLMAPAAPARQTEGEPLDDFRRVMVAGAVDLNVHGDAKVASAEIDCPTRNGPGIQLHVQDDTLMVTPMHEDQRNTGRCVLTLRTSGLEGVQISGASKVRGGALSQLEAVQVGGAADLDLRGLGADTFELNVAGAGKARLSGKVDQATLVIAGAADIDATALTAKTAHLTTHGAGNIQATVKDTVHATSAGAGVITVLGGPDKVHQTTAGIGQVVVK